VAAVPVKWDLHHTLCCHVLLASNGGEYCKNITVNPHVSISQMFDRSRTVSSALDLICTARGSGGQTAPTFPMQADDLPQIQWSRHIQIQNQSRFTNLLAANRLLVLSVEPSDEFSNVNVSTLLQKGLALVVADTRHVSWILADD
jgi:hypothetical protein